MPLETDATGMDVGQRGGILLLAVLPGDVKRPIGSEGLAAERHPGVRFG